MVFKDKNEFENEIIKYLKVDNKNVNLNININANKLKKENDEKPTEPEQIVLENILPEQTIDFNFDLFEIINDIKDRKKEFQDEKLSFSIASNNIIYKKSVSYNNCNSIKSLKFVNSQFEKSVRFYDIKSITDLEFHSCKFLENIKFFNTTFESSLKFFKPKINNITFKNCFFNNTNFIIDDPIFIEQASLKLENLKSETTSTVKISYNKDNTNNINKNPKEFTFAQIDKKISIILKNIICENINLSETENEENIKLINCNFINCFDTETASILKNIEYKKSNTIKALEYKAKEIEKHKEDLLKEIKKKFNIKKFGDILSISLSSFYSENGLNWIKSLRRTILITIILFSIFYFPDIFHLNCIFNKLYYKNYLYKLVEYFIPTYYNCLIEYVKNSDVSVFIKICGIIVYFLGKIMFWYGSVQTVQAFRKFSKKE